MKSDRERQWQELDEICHNLIRLFQREPVGVFNNRLKGISPLEISILSMVKNNPDIILKDIVQELQVAGSTLTSAVDRLEKRGLVKRTISSRDRRSFGLELTEQGILAQEEHKKDEKTVLAAILNTFDNEEERETFIRLLKKMLQGIVHTDSLL